MAQLLGECVCVYIVWLCRGACEPQQCRPPPPRPHSQTHTSGPRATIPSGVRLRDKRCRLLTHSLARSRARERSLAAKQIEFVKIRIGCECIFSIYNSKRVPGRQTRSRDNIVPQTTTRKRNGRGAGVLVFSQSAYQ